MVKKAVIINVSNTLIPSNLRARTCAKATFLILKFLRGEGFKASNIIILAEDSHVSPNDSTWEGIEEIDEDPTKKNIKDRLHWLTKSAGDGDELFCYFGGHGGITSLGPLDDDLMGGVSTKDVYNFLVRNLPSGCRLTAIFDTCHAGSMLSLKYKYTSANAIRQDTLSKRTSYQTSDGDVIFWAACSHEGKSYGYNFTNLLADYVHNHSDASYARVFQHIINNLNVNGVDKPELITNKCLDSDDMFFG
jgi:hypothetical protein